MRLLILSVFERSGYALSAPFDGFAANLPGRDFGSR